MALELRGDGYPKSFVFATVVAQGPVNALTGHVVFVSEKPARPRSRYVPVGRNF
jgi:hypothetical protein